MPKYVRTGLDIDVAVQAPSAVGVPSVDLPPRPDPSTAAVVPPVALAQVRARARRVVRRVGASVFRATHPMLLPLAIRARRFMSAELHLTMALDTNHIAHELGDTEARTAERLDGAVAELIRQVQAESVATRREVVELVDVLRSSLGAEVARSGELGAQTVLSTISPRLDRLEAYSSTMARRMVVPLGDREVMVGTAFGFVLCPISDAATIAGLVDTGDIERGTRLLIERVLAAGSSFVDVGANVGVHTLAGARAVGPAGRVVAVEPFPPTAGLLRRSLALNGHSNYEVVEAAVGERVGRALLHLGAMSGHHSLLELDEGAGEVIEVPVVPIDDVIPPGLHVDLLKIDVEGAELAVLRGATRVLAESPDVVVIVEFGPSHLARAGTEVVAWFDEIDDLGFRWVVIDPFTGTLSESTPDQVGRVESSNLLLARPEAAVWRGRVAEGLSA